MSEMRLAFSIAAHKLPGQVQKLIDLLADSDDIILVHVDRRAVPIFCEHLEHLTARGRVVLLPSRDLAWGGWSICQMQLDAIAALRLRPEPWLYAINLSGQDFPVRPIAELRDFLSRANGASFIEMKPMRDARHFRRRLRWICIERRGKVIRLPIPNLRARDLEIDWYGSFWCMLSRQFCDWLITSGMADRCRAALRNVKVPDEFLFQTAAMNGPFTEHIVPRAQRFISWDGGSHPSILTCHDLDRIRASGAFFARKFDETRDGEIISRLSADRQHAIRT